MKNANRLFFRVLIFLITVVSSNATAQSSISNPKDTKLYKTILHMDSVMFDAFNAQNIDVLSRCLQPMLSSIMTAEA